MTAMKKIYILSALAALLAFTACSKESTETPEVNTDKASVLTFTSKRPQLKSDTKTAWDATSSSIVWSENDKIRVGYTLNGAWMGQSSAGEAKFYASDAVSIDANNHSVGTFTVPISPSTFVDPETSGTYKFFAVYPKDILNSTVSDPTAQSITIPETQTLASGTFDPSADVLVGQSSEMVLTGLPTDPISLSWTRLVAHADLTFSNLAFVGTETVNKITLTFNEAAKVAGAVAVNIPAGTAGAGSTNVIVLSSNEGIESSSSNFEAWACVLPVTFTSLDVEIKTDKATYTRSITGISKTFKQNSRNTLTINMSTATRTAEVTYDWVKTDLSAITSSDIFVIVGNNGSNYAMSNNNGTTAAPSAVAVTVANNKLSHSPSESIQWTLSKDGSDYTFYPNGTTATWLYCTATNNGVRVGTNANKVFTLEASSGYLKNTATSRYIGVYNSSDWRCYTSTSTNIAGQTFAFYVRTAVDPRTDPGLAYSESSYSAVLNSPFTAPTLTNPYSVSVSYESSNTAVATVDASTGAITLHSAGNTTITASFSGDPTYKPASAEYTLVVTDPNANDGSAEKPYTASEAITAAESLGSSTRDNVYVKGIVCTAGNLSSGSVIYYISDDGTTTNRFEIYKGKYISGADFTEGTNLKVGDFVKVKGTLKYYNNTTAEFESGSELISVIHIPTFDPNGGTFNATQNVTITADAGAVIRYTTDGTTNPTATTGDVYNGPITINATTTIKAIAVKDGASTGVVSKTFTKSSGMTSYTLTPASGSNNSYANNCDIEIGGITWNLTGNSTTQPWRIGGKNLTGVDRALYSKNALPFNVGKIVITHGSASNITVNSMTVIVASDASFNTVVSTLTPTFAASDDITINRPSGVSWENCYFKIIYNVSVSGNTNRYVEFTKAVFTQN